MRRARAGRAGLSHGPGVGVPVRLSGARLPGRGKAGNHRPNRVHAHHGQHHLVLVFPPEVRKAAAAFFPLAQVGTVIV